MRWMALAGLSLAFAAPLRAENIVDVLHRSQQQRLEALRPADGERATTVRQSFERLRALLRVAAPLELQVVSGAIVAETFHGRLVVANESLAELPEGERLFILAHEIGHVQAAHWAQLGRLYLRWVPGEVVPEKTDPVAAPLGREASAMSHRQEYEADVFALQALRQLQRPASDAYALFMRQGLQFDTATHPGTRKRIAWLRAAEAARESLPSGSDAE